MSQLAEQIESDERDAPRISLLMRPAKLIMAECEFLCIIRDLSETGISVRLLHPLVLDRRLSIEFQTGTQLEIETIWQREAAAGFRFAAPLDLAREITGIGKHPKRPLRLNLCLPITISTGGSVSNATLRDLSNHGAKIEIGTRLLAIGELIHIETPGLPLVRARVRWRKSDTYGLVFVDTFSLGELARYTASVQLNGPAGTVRAVLSN